MEAAHLPPAALHLILLCGLQGCSSEAHDDEAVAPLQHPTSAQSGPPAPGWSLQHRTSSNTAAGTSGQRQATSNASDDMQGGGQEAPLQVCLALFCCNVPGSTRGALLTPVCLGFCTRASAACWESAT